MNDNVSTPIIGFDAWYAANQAELISYYNVALLQGFETIKDFAIEVYFEFDNLPGIATL